MATFRRRVTLGVEIGASAEQAWRVLADLSQLSHWNPLLLRVSGLDVSRDRPGPRMRLGQKLFRFSVFKSEPNHELRWRGRFLFPGLFHDESVFVIESVDERCVWLTLQQVFTGLLAPLLDGFAEANARRGIQSLGRMLSCTGDGSTV